MKWFLPVLVIFLVSCKKDIDVIEVSNKIESSAHKTTTDSFSGYKVAANARQLGTDYWENTPVLSDLMIGVFQKNFEVFLGSDSAVYRAWTQAIFNGDFNNDGYIDFYNAGSAFG